MKINIPIIYKNYTLAIIIDYWHVDVYLWNNHKSINLIDWVNPIYK